MNFVNVGEMQVGTARKDEPTESQEAVNTLNYIFNSFFLNKSQRLNNSLQKHNEVAMGIFCGSDLFPPLLIQKEQTYSVSYPSKQNKPLLEKVNRSLPF